MSNLLKYLFYIVFILIFLSIFSIIFYKYFRVEQDTIKVGVLFSETGTMADSEKPVMNATLLAIEQINQNGGINGKQIEPIVYDGASNWERYASLAKKMIVEDGVKVIFGCWTSASRKEVKPIVEKYNNLLIYPTQYEGAEESPNIIYLGETPNQQILPAISWMVGNHGKKFFLVGSDYIYPHVANEIIAHDIKLMGGEVVATRYIPLGSHKVDDVMEEIINKQPDAIINTINGDTNIAFFNRLFDLTKNSKRPPVMSFSLSSTDMEKIGMKKMIGDYAVWSYFPTQNTPNNLRFLSAYKAKYHTVDGINAPAATEYGGVYLWAQAARESPSIEPYAVREFMLRQSVSSPAGVIYIDPANGAAWRTIMIARVNSNGMFDVVWNSYNPVQPIIYMDFKSKAEWDLFEYQLYSKWQKSWENHN